MFNIGDVIIYSAHGLCKIEDICEKTVSNVTRTYYVLRPLEGSNLTISTPVDNDKVVMLKVMEREEAERILQTFTQPSMKWIKDVRERNRHYNDLINSGDRQGIAQVANMLMRKDLELSQDKKKLYDQDRKRLQAIQDILFKELALSLGTSMEDVVDRVSSMINKSVVEKL